MIIRTERLVLRPFEPGDLDTMHAYAGDEANTEYMVYLPNSTKDETERFLRFVIAEWEKGEQQGQQVYEFAIVFDGKHIGAISVNLVEDRQSGGLGWIIHRDYHGKGFATEAAMAIMDFAFNELHVKKVFADCDHRNGASIKIMEKIGMTLERDNLLRRYRGSDEDVQGLMYSRWDDITRRYD